jgi:SAM-dependent methyltransferase
MLDQARSVPDGSGAELRWCEASALELPYEDGAFDTVICQQGLQFFPDPRTGIEEMARVTRDGGRLGVTVWSPAEQSPFLHRETQMLARHGGEVRAEFSATERELREWFRAERVDNVSVELITVEIDLPPVLTYVPGHLRALPWSTSFLGLPGEQQVAALDELDDDLAEYRTDDGIRVPFSSYLVRATCRSSVPLRG